MTMMMTIVDISFKLVQRMRVDVPKRMDYMNFMEQKT